MAHQKICNPRDKRYTEELHETMTDNSDIQQGPSLSRLAMMRGLNLCLWDGALSTVFVTLTWAGVFLTGFAIMIGANTTQIGLLASIAALSGFSQILCPYIS